MLRIVGTLTNKANVSIYYYLVRDRLSTDSKTRDLEWPIIRLFIRNNVQQVRKKKKIKKKKKKSYD